MGTSHFGVLGEVAFEAEMEEITVGGALIALHEALDLGVDGFGESVGLSRLKVVENGDLMMSHRAGEGFHFIDTGHAHLLDPFLEPLLGRC